jgi:hypothetical protein
MAPRPRLIVSKKRLQNIGHNTEELFWVLALAKVVI